MLLAALDKGVLVEASPIEPVSIEPGATKQAYIFRARRGSEDVEKLDDLAYHDLEAYLGGNPTEESLLTGLRLARRVEELKLASGMRLGPYERLETGLQVVAAGALFLQLGNLLNEKDTAALAAVRPQGGSGVGIVLALRSLLVRVELAWPQNCLRQMQAQLDKEAEVLQPVEDESAQVYARACLDALIDEPKSLEGFYDGVSTAVLQAQKEQAGVYHARVDEKEKIGLSTNNCGVRVATQGKDVSLVVVAPFPASFEGAGVGGTADRDGMRTWVVEALEAMLSIERGGLGSAAAMFGSPATLLGSGRASSALARARRRGRLDALFNGLGLRMGNVGAALKSRAEAALKVYNEAAAAIDDAQQQEEDVQAEQRRLHSVTVRWRSRRPRGRWGKTRRWRSCASRTSAPRRRCRPCATTCCG